MSLVYACITPHGGEIIPELTGKNNLERMSVTRASMNVLGERLAEARPEALVIFTPHGTRIDGQFSVVNSERMIGSFGENGRTYTMTREVDRHLALSLASEAERSGLPVGVLNYGTTEGPLSVMTLDWGALVPLSFFPDLPIVVITPSRLLTNEQLMAFGKAVRHTIDQSDKRIGLIASCDWSHTHDANGPYGYHQSAKDVDLRCVELIKNGNLEGMEGFTPQEIDEAKPDGIWQTLMLAGAVREEERQVDVLSYEAPTYFGLICAEVFS
ncbi:MAG TPA: extradiol ring-cleavage dioxygenase [Candidatus Angelobacter sp.]|nr:extradiol ring-cleavage dioxygenase [Candidatus Angelobacter sp.]